MNEPSRPSRRGDRITTFFIAVQNVHYWHKADIPGAKIRQTPAGVPAGQVGHATWSQKAWAAVKTARTGNSPDGSG